MNKYFYFSNLLPFINANKEFFLNTVAISPDNLAYFISEDAPKHLCKIFNEEFEKVPIKNISADLKQNSKYNVLFVEFDDDYAQEITDCYAIAIAISPENDIRLFTYEKGESFLDKTPLHYVGEFKEDGTHTNYGTTSEKRVSLFSGKIMGVLNSK